MQSYTTILKERLNFKIEYDTQLNFNFEIIEPGDIKLKLKFWKKNDKIKSIFTSPIFNNKLKFSYEIKPDHILIGFIPTKIGYHLIKTNNPDILYFKILVTTKSFYRISSNLLINLTSKDKNEQFNDKLINRSDNNQQYNLKINRLDTIVRLDNTINSDNSKRKVKFSNHFNDKLDKQKERSFNNLNFINESNLIENNFLKSKNYFNQTNEINDLSQNLINSNNLSQNLLNSSNESNSSIDSINSIHNSTSSTESIKSFNNDNKFIDYNGILNNSKSNTSSLNYNKFLNNSKFNCSSIDYNKISNRSNSNLFNYDKILNSSKSNTNLLDDKQVYIYELIGPGNDEYEKIKQSTYEQLCEDVRNEENNRFMERSFNQSINSDNKFDFNFRYYFNQIGKLFKSN